MRFPQTVATALEPVFSLAHDCFIVLDESLCHTQDGRAVGFQHAALLGLSYPGQRICDGISKLGMCCKRDESDAARVKTAFDSVCDSETVF